MRQRFRWVATIGMCLGVMALGCDTARENAPTNTPVPDTLEGDSAAGDTDAVSDLTCADEAYVRSILEGHCTACHGATRPSAGLDLETPEILARLAARTSVHAMCRNMPIAVPGAPAEGIFMGKLLGTLVGCGDSMPPDGPLAPADLQCLARWIGAARIVP